MPLTSKGSEIMENMKKEYGPAKGEEVFYASKNAGKISGVDNAIPAGPTPVVDAQEYGPDSATSLPASVSLREMNEANERYWVQKGGEFKKNDY